MMTDAIKQYDEVALVDDLPEAGLVRGQVGYVIEIHAPDVVEVEFSNTKGITYAMLTLRGEQVMILRHEPAVQPLPPTPSPYTEREREKRVREESMSNKLNAPKEQES